MARSLGSLLIVVGMLAPAVGRAAETLDGWQSTVARYARLDSAEQWQETHALIARLDRANRAILTPDEAAAKEAHHALLLDQMAQGRTLDSGELLALLGEIERVEKAAVEQLARRFRIQTYDTFRADREEYVRRRAASDLAETTYEAAGSPADRQGVLVDWYEAALRCSMPGAIGPMPRLPDFSVPWVEPPSEPTSPVGPVVSGPTIPSGPTTSRPSNEPQSRHPLGDMARPTEPRPTPPVDPTGPRRMEPTTALPDEPISPRRRPTELPVASGPIVSGPIVSGPIVSGPIISGPTVSEPVASPVEIVSRGDGARREAAPPVVRLPPLTNVAPTVPETPRDRPPVASQRIASSGVPNPGGASRGIARSPVSLPLAGSANVAQPPPAGSRNVAQPPPAGREITPTPPGATVLHDDPTPPGATVPHNDVATPPRTANAHGINVAELAARVAGINMALQSLDADLAGVANGGGPWNAPRLAALTDRLEILTIRRNDLEIFCALITPRERAQVGPLDSPGAMVSRMAARVAEARLHAMGPDFPGTIAERQAELDQLDTISRRLVKLAGGP